MKERQKVLVIDDSRLIHRITETRLRDLNVDMIAAETGAFGIQRATDDAPDLILLDLTLEDMTGFEVIAQIKEDPNTRDIPIIFLTGESDPDHKVRGFDLGAVDYIVKPFNPAELRARVRAALRTKTLMDLLAQQAQMDGLTGLHNRRHFDERLEQEMSLCHRHGHNLGLLLFDIDHFKQINDQFGHPKGDQVLTHFAALLKHVARTSDLPCRWGGDEFAVILPMADAAAVERAGQRVQEKMCTDEDFQQILNQPITASIGATSTFGEEKLPLEQFLKRADQALYQSKQHGRNQLTLAA